MSGDKLSKRRSVRDGCPATKCPNDGVSAIPLYLSKFLRKLILLGRLYYSIVLSSEISGEVCLFMCVNSLDQIIQD